MVSIKGKVSWFLACIWLVFAGAVALQADDLRSYGTPDGSKPEYSELEFLRGEWDISIVVIDIDGNRKPIDYTSHVTAFYHSDGRTFQTCFTASGFYSTDIQAYDETAGKWRAHFLNATLQRWSHFTKQKKGETIENYVPGGFSGDAEDTRSVVRGITADSFFSDVFQKVAGSDTWRQTYEMTYTRAPYHEHGPRC